MSLLNEINRSRQIMGLPLLTEVKVKKNERVVWYDEPNLYVATVKTFNASCKYGATSSYCVAAPGNNGSYFNNDYKDIVFTYFNNYEVTPEGKRGDKINWDLLQYHVNSDKFTWRHMSNKRDDPEPEFEYPDGLIERVKYSVRDLVRRDLNNNEDNGVRVVDNLRGYIQKYDSNDNLIYREKNGTWKKWEYDDDRNLTYYGDSNGYWEKKRYQNGKEIYYEDNSGFIKLVKFDKHGTISMLKTPKMGTINLKDFNYQYQDIIKFKTFGFFKEKNEIRLKFEEINPISVDEITEEEGILSLYITINIVTGDGEITAILNEGTNQQADYNEETFNLSGEDDTNDQIKNIMDNFLNNELI